MFAAAFDALLIAALLFVASLVWQRRPLEQAATAAGWLAFVLLGAALAVRGADAHRWPLTDRFEFAVLFGWATLGVYLVLEAAGQPRLLGAFVVPITVGLVSYALLGIPPEQQAARPLSPVLRSIWLEIHVLTAAIGYGAGGVAAGCAACYLVQGRLPGMAARLEPELVQEATYRAVAAGFPFLSAAILAGAIWAQSAWGRFWGWDLKESWALLTWLVYLLFLHGRALRGWRGRPLAWLALLGFACVLFTFLGVNRLASATRMESLHVF